MRMKKILLLMIVFFSEYSVALESLWMDDVENLSVDYRIIKKCGDWRAGGEVGYYRLVVVDVYGGAGSEIYAQWITNPTAENKSKLVKTLAFSELNNDHSQYFIQSADCERRNGSTYINLKALYEHDEKNKLHDISIKLIDVGRYELRERGWR